MRVFVVVLLVACGGDKATPEPAPTKPAPTKPAPAKPAPAKPEPASANAQPDLKATLDGKPVAIQSVLAVDRGDGQIEVELRNYLYTCKELAEGFTTRASQPTDLSLKLRIGKYLHKDGALGWAIRGRYFHDGGPSTSQTEKEDGGFPFPPGTSIDPAAGKTSDLPLDVTHETIGDDKSPKRTLIVKGTAKVTGCGDSKFKNKDPRPEPQAGEIEIAGQKLPIVGAGYIVKKDGRRTLEIATHPVKCVEGSDYTADAWADVGLELAWDKTKLYAVELSGSWIDWAVNQNSPTLTATPNRAPLGAKEMTVTLGGSTTINGYPVALRGKVKAIVCPTPK